MADPAPDLLAQVEQHCYVTYEVAPIGGEPEEWARSEIDLSNTDTLDALNAALEDVVQQLRVKLGLP